MNIFSKAIIDWYKENKRELPWRESSDPYLIWISEIILQQTRVAQGYDYFLRFIKRFPDVQSLADADEDEVMKFWQGLGYYSRARNLHAAAKSMNGVFPKTYPEVLALKGVGEYTAAAICSCCCSRRWWHWPASISGARSAAAAATCTDSKTPIFTGCAAKSAACFRVLQRERKTNGTQRIFRDDDRAGW